MEGFIHKLELSSDQLINLPLFFRVIYYNEMSNIDEETKLMKFNKRIGAVQIRHFEPSRIICKSIDTKDLID